MDKKKIALFSSGWSGEILYKYLIGLHEGLENLPVDIYMFMSHAVFGIPEADMHGELNIYQLPNMKDFDAALLFANGLDFPNLINDLTSRCEDAHVPVIMTGKEDERFYFVGTDNFIGTKDLAEHIIEKHGVRDIWFLAGTPENMDSNDRLRAVQTVFKEHGLVIAEENICYTHWSPYVGCNFIEEQLKKGKSLPDAIVCANDTLAMVISNYLGDRGYSVPEDVIITGFDNEVLAQAYDPSISSVDQRFDNIGRKVAYIVKNIFEGNEVEKIHRTQCEFVPSESCGCCAARDFDAMRRKIGKDRFSDRFNNSSFDMKLNTMERTILQGNSFDALRSAFEQINSDNNQYESPTFYVFIDPLVEKSLHDSQRQLRTVGYPEYMNMVYSKEQGYVQDIKEFETRKILPQLNPQIGNRFYIILPLYDNEYEIGYVVLGDDYQKVWNAQQMRKYLERLNIILNRFFQKLKLNALNQRLLQMTETDAMTHVKNRTAFETRLGDMQDKISSEMKPEFAMILFDINNLKTINDSLGHEAGDEYIINSCRLICKTFKKSAVYRIGGDEFVVILERDDYDAREKLLDEMKEAMSRLEKAEIPLYEKISIASGMAVYDMEEDFHIQEVFNRADAAMYENKALMKGSK